MINEWSKCYWKTLSCYTTMPSKWSTMLAFSIIRKHPFRGEHKIRDEASVWIAADTKHLAHLIGRV